MKDKINAKIDCNDDITSNQIQHFKNLTNIGIALSVEKDTDKVFDLILEEALLFTNADGATIYTLSEDKKKLDFKLVYNSTMDIIMGGKHSEITWPSLVLKDEDGRESLINMATYAANTGKAVKFDDVYEQTMFDNTGTKKFDEMNNYRSKSMVAIPLKDHEDEILGVIQLINPTDADGNIITFTDDHMELLSSLSSITAMIMTNRKLIEGLESLLHQFIRSIAKTIDKKSKYTGGHIARVALLTEKIAERINTTKRGHYRNTFFDENQMKEISMSGWMHDLGKIITPECIMDKGTKLECINDRIDHVITRFSLVKSLIRKDIKIKELRHQNADHLQDLLAQLEEDQTFIEQCNIGSEFMEDWELDRIKSIEDFRYTSDDETYYLISEDESRNLCIRKGTLLPEEFAIMKEHASVTASMLHELSFPHKYENVALYASSHHEKINGKGYPTGLSGEKLPLQARIIAVADLFEALTAVDRPYKKGKKLTEALTIMAFMAKDGEIDKNLLDLFIDEKMYIDYAEKYLVKAQIDDVDTRVIKALYR